MRGSVTLRRFVSIIADGAPVKGQVGATVVEFLVGALCVFALFKFAAVLTRSRPADGTAAPPSLLSDVVVLSLRR